MSKQLIKPIESAEEFIKRTKYSRLGSKRKVPVITRDAFIYLEVKAITMMPLGNGDIKILTVERFEENDVNHVYEVNEREPTSIRYGYYMVGQNGNKIGKWTWGESCAFIKPSDLKALNQLAIKEGTIKKENIL